MPSFTHAAEKGASKTADAAVTSSPYKTLSEIAEILKKRAKKEKLDVNKFPNGGNCTLTDYNKIVDPKTNGGKMWQRVGNVNNCPGGLSEAELRADDGKMYSYYNDGKGGDKIVRFEQFGW